MFVELKAGYQSWRQLLFIHWPVAASELRPLVPPPLSIDEFEGQAYVSLVPFVVLRARSVSAPAALGVDFMETNVRTYVNLDGEHGVYFFSLDAASLVATLGARTLLGLPYFWAAGHTYTSGGRVEYALRRRLGSRAHVVATYEVGSATGIALPGTLDFFLIERYFLHVRRGGSLWTIRVVHEPYPLRGVDLIRCDDDLVAAAGIDTSGTPPLVHFSTGVDVTVLAPRIRLLLRARAPPNGSSRPRVSWNLASPDPVSRRHRNPRAYAL